MNNPKVKIKVNNNINEAKGKKFYFYVYGDNTKDVEIRFVEIGSVFTKKNIVADINEFNIILTADNMNFDLIIEEDFNI